MAVKTKAPTYKPHRFATLEDVQGRLAVVMGTTLLNDRPINEVRYRVSIQKTTDEYIAQFVGRELSPGSRYTYVILPGGRDVHFPDWDTWEIVIVEEECPKPKDGKEYGWRWDPSAASYQNRLYPERTGWVKDNYPRCQNCHETHYTSDNGKSVRWSPYHSPDLTVAEECGWCHRGGVCDKKGPCKPFEA